MRTLARPHLRDLHGDAVILGSLHGVGNCPHVSFVGNRLDIALGDVLLVDRPLEVGVELRPLAAPVVILVELHGLAVFIAVLINPHEYGRRMLAFARPHLRNADRGILDFGLRRRLSRRQLGERGVYRTALNVIGIGNRVSLRRAFHVVIKLQSVRQLGEGEVFAVLEHNGVNIIISRLDRNSIVSDLNLHSVISAVGEYDVKHEFRVRVGVFAVNNVVYLERAGLIKIREPFHIGRNVEHIAAHHKPVNDLQLDFGLVVSYAEPAVVYLAQLVSIGTVFLKFRIPGQNDVKALQGAGHSGFAFGEADGGYGSRVHAVLTGAVHERQVGHNAGLCALPAIRLHALVRLEACFDNLEIKRFGRVGRAFVKDFIGHIEGDSLASSYVLVNDLAALLADKVHNGRYGFEVFGYYRAV